MTDLFNWAASFRRTDPVTSSHAGRAAVSLAKRHHDVILMVLRCNARPMAAEEISARCFIDHVAINRRLIEMERGGLVRKTTERHRNRSGRQAFRYALAVCA